MAQLDTCFSFIFFPDMSVVATKLPKSFRSEHVQDTQKAGRWTTEKIVIFDGWKQKKGLCHSPRNENRSAWS